MSKITKPDTKIVSGIQFSISSPDEIRRTSVVEVTKTDTYEKDIYYQTLVKQFQQLK